MNKIFLQSHKAEKGNNNQPIFSILSGSAKKIRGLRVESVKIPLSFYFVSGTIDWESTGSGGAQSQTITSGNYTGTQFATALQALLVVHDATATVSFDSITQKLTFTAAGIDIKGTGTLNIHMGFGTTDTGASSSQTATNVIYLVPSSLYLYSSRLSHGFDNTLNNIKSSVIAEISVDKSMYSLLKWVNYDILSYYSFNDVLKEIDLEFRDDQGTLIDFNGLPWSVTLGVRQVYEIGDYSHYKELSNSYEQKWRLPFQQ